jgi:hypothetical protein
VIPYAGSEQKNKIRCLGQSGAPDLFWRWRINFARAASSTNPIDPNESAGDAVHAMRKALALLQARSNLGDSLIAESLKMSYLTGPNRAELIPTRLDTVTLSHSLNDADLKELARGDVRAILTQFPDRRQALVNDYVRGSSIGKTFLEETVRMFDPKFADSLRSAK